MQMLETLKFELKPKQLKHRWITQKRAFRRYWKYEKHRHIHKAILFLLIGGVPTFVLGGTPLLNIMKFPTEDPNKLMADPYWAKKKTEIDKRKQEMRKRAEESGVLAAKNPTRE